MQTITRAVERPESKSSQTGKPVVIKWNNTPMLRSQSVNAAINDIYESSRSMFFIKVNLVGASGSGKSVLSSVLAHGLHTRDPSFSVHFLQDSDLVNFKETIQRLPKGNVVLVFDDLSGIVAKYGKAALERLRAEITVARHIDNLESRKIVMILNFHAQKLLDKFLRISNFTFYTDCQLEEIGYLEELLGKEHSLKIKRFAKLRAQSRMYHKFSFPLGKKDVFTYRDGDPFRVLLYNNGISTRFVVSPQLSWVLGDEKCQICEPSEKTEQTKINLKQFADDISKKFGKGIVKRSIELRLLRHGFYVQPKRVQQCEKYLEQFFAAKSINLEELAKLYGLEERTTRLFPDKQPEFLPEVKA